MMKRALVVCTLGLLLFTPLISVFTHPAENPPWGFFGHRRINRLAVFTLPPEMIGFYKQHIEYITEHAVDPDKRRYATRHEAVRHYIDIDHWDRYPFLEVPRDWTDALIKHTRVSVVTEEGDTLALFEEGLPADADSYRRFFREVFLPQYYEDSWACSCAALDSLLGQPIPGCVEVLAVDEFSAFGILPYHLLSMQRRLTRAFEEGDPQRILQLSTEMGHYIADAHVPLHTTENYNGQLTGQEGIHAFWESRLPELFADEQYDYFVGPAQYIQDPASYFWEVVLDSHMLLDSVLAIEKTLSQAYPPDRQFCYEERAGLTTRTQCPDYAQTYHTRLDGQVEARMRASIKAIGSAWYTAWVDAGSPKLNKGLGSGQPAIAESDSIKSGPVARWRGMMARPHE
ncbi:MAG: hypothetical protein IPJ40_07005 [Saprospirales bacterium]|nr:hypothetical protein [Saprospirales bacterium]